jgi:SAM-dependent MidA family methyltransferase
MEQLILARKLLRRYNINNDALAYDIAILMVEAQKELIKEQLENK